MPFNALMQWLGKKAKKGSYIADTLHQKGEALQDLRYSSDEELKTYLKNGTPNERDAARAILQIRK